MRDSESSRPIYSLAQLVERLGTLGTGLAEILDSLGEAVTIRNPQHEIIYANRRAVEHMNFQSLEELRSAGPTAIMAHYIVQDEAGNELTMQDMPSVRQLAGQPATPLLIRTVHPRHRRREMESAQGHGLARSGG